MTSIPKTASSSPRRNLPLSLAAAVAMVLGGQSAPAASLTWDANPSSSGVQDGTGTWSTSSNNWLSGGANVLWNNAAPDAATFGGGTGAGTAGTVTLGSDITVGNITFATTGSGTYTIDGGGKTLTLFNTTIGGTASATIKATLAGNTGLSVTNTGGILLNGNNTYSGTTIVGTGTSTNGSAAVLKIGSVNALGESTDIRVGNGAALTIAVPDSTSTLVGSGKTLTLYGAGPGSNGALQGTTGVNSTWAGNIVIGDSGTSNTVTRISGGSGGTLTISGVISEVAQNSSVIFNRIANSTTVLNAVNTYKGDTTLFNNGVVNGVPTTSTLKIGVDNAINANSRLNALGADATAKSVLDLNGHVLTLRGLDTFNSPSASSSANLIAKNDGSVASILTVGDATAINTATFGGLIQDGNGGMSLVKTGANIQILVGANTYTGSTTVNSGTLQVGAATPTTNIHFLGSNGSLASANFQLNGGSFVVDNKGASNNNSNRILDSASFALNGGAFVYRGSDQPGTNSSEKIGSIIFGRGLSTLTVSYGATNTAVLTADSISRTVGGGGGLVNGANLGKDGTSTASVGRLLLSSEPPLLVGATEALDTGINAGAKNTKIVPYLLGEAAETTGGLGTVSGKANTFVTYNSATGLRPLNPIDEFENNIITSGANTRITATTSVSSSAAINSLILAAPADTVLTIDSGKTLTNSSGAMLFVNTNRVTGGTLDFGSTEALLSVNSGATGIIASAITGSGGLSFFGQGTLALASTQSTYTGNTTLQSGVLAVTGSSSFNTQGTLIGGPFGLSTVVFAGSQIRTQDGDLSTPITVGNAVKFQADTTFTMNSGQVGSKFVFTGPVALENGTRTLTVANEKGVTFSGVISDGGQGNGLTFDKSGTGNGSVLLSGNNTYTGPTTIKSGKVEVSGTIGGSSSVAVNNSGSLILSGTASDRIADTAPVTLGTSGATTGDATFGINNSALGVAFSENVGKLTLASNAVLDLGTGDFGTILHFADSSSSSWSGTLKIYNWTGSTDHLFFGDSLGGLTPSQVSQVLFYSDAGTAPLGSGMILTSGEMVPVPEPSTLLGGAALLGFLGWRERRKISRAFSRKS